MTNHSVDDKMMLRALELARAGLGYVSPNPLVGCVVVSPDGTIIGEGAHLRYGEAHAEPNAIANAEAHGHSVSGSTVYVTLEPHSHQGKTPPCSELLIGKGIARCVVAMEDPNPKVRGDGIRQLRDAGIEVVVGVEEDAARELNRFFIKHITTGVPYVTLKLASSLDGRSALATGESRWITSEASRRIVHQMRAEYDAVLIGASTANSDDPELTVRLVEGRNPRAIILAGTTLPRHTLKLLRAPHMVRSMVIAPEETSMRGSDPLLSVDLRIVRVPSRNGRADLPSVFRELGSMGINSVLVEAGPNLAASMLSDSQCDEVVHFLAPTYLGGDAQASVGPLKLESLVSAATWSVAESRVVEGSHDWLIRLRRAQSSRQEPA